MTFEEFWEELKPTIKPHTPYPVIVENVWNILQDEIKACEYVIEQQRQIIERHKAFIDELERSVFKIKYGSVAIGGHCYKKEWME